MTTRRSILQSTSAGFGWLAFNALHQQWASAAAPPKTINPLAPKAPHFAAKAKRVIFIFCGGGPSPVNCVVLNGRNQPGRYPLKRINGSWLFW